MGRTRGVSVSHGWLAPGGGNGAGMRPLLRGMKRNSSPRTVVVQGALPIVQSALGFLLALLLFRGRVPKILKIPPLAAPDEPLPHLLIVRRACPPHFFFPPPSPLARTLVPALPRSWSAAATGASTPTTAQRRRNTSCIAGFFVMAGLRNAGKMSSTLSEPTKKRLHLSDPPRAGSRRAGHH